MTKQTRILTALMLCCVMLVPMSATASAAPAATGAETTTQAKAKIKAELLDSKVKVNGKARVRGDLDLGRGSAVAGLGTAERGLELVVVQKLVAGVWIDVGSTSCRPSGSFRLAVSFSVAAQYSLRVYHPTTAVFSSVLSLLVVG